MICGCNSNEVEDTVPTQPDQKITTPTPAKRKSTPLAVVEEDVYSVSNGPSSASSEDQRPPSDDDDYENDKNDVTPIIDPSATNVNTDGYLEGPPTGWGGNYSPEVEVNEETAPALISGPRKANMKNVQHHEDYIDGTRTDQEVSAGVIDRIKGLEDAGLQTSKRMGRKMLSPRIITDVKELWDRDGNITREMTHYIEEPDGTKRTEKETVYIAAGAASGEGEYASGEEASDGASEGEGGWEADLAAEEERNKQYKKSSKYTATTSGEGGSDGEIEIFVDDEDEDKGESGGWEVELAAEEEKNKQFKESSKYTATTSGEGASESEIEIEVDDEDEDKGESGGWEAELAAEEEKNKQFKKSSK